MEDLVKFIAQALADYPEDIKVITETEGTSETITLYCNPEDMGKLIGKQGKIANSIRTILKARAIKDDVLVSLEIEENS